MRFFKSFLVILVLATSLPALHVTPTFSQETLHNIQVRVVDQYSVDYDGVEVEVYRGKLIDSGLTTKGTWTSKPVEGSGRLYDVVIFNGEQKTWTIPVVSSDAHVEFTLERRSPAPILLVSNVNITPESVMVGGNFSVDLKIQNVGEVEAVTAVLNLNLSYPFALIGSGSALNIGEVEVGGNRTLKYTFSVDSSAWPGTYSIPYVVSYSDPNHYAFTSSGKFGVVIQGIPDILIQDITVDPTWLTPSAEGILTVQLINVGTDAAMDVTIKILNVEQLLANSITYVGQIDPGDTRTAIFGIHISPEADKGIRFLTIDITFKDPAGNIFSLSKNYELAVYEVEPFIPTYYYFLIGGVMVALICVYVFVRRLGFEIW